MITAPLAYGASSNVTPDDNNLYLIQQPSDKTAGKSSDKATGRDHKKDLDKYPNTTPIQESIKASIKIMKHGDPKKPKGDNGMRNADEIPGLKTKLLGVEEIKKDGKVIGKKISTKTTLTFKNAKQQMGKTKDWSKLSITEADMPENSKKSVVQLCKEMGGKMKKQECDLEEVILEKLNKKIKEDLGGEPLRIPKKDFKGKNPKQDDYDIIKPQNGKYFKGLGNANGIDSSNLARVVEIEETVQHHFNPDEEYSFVKPINFEVGKIDETISRIAEFDSELASMILPEAEGLEGDAESRTVEKLMMMGFTVAPGFIWQIEERGILTLWYSHPHPYVMYTTCGSWWHLHSCDWGGCNYHKHGYCTDWWGLWPHNHYPVVELYYIKAAAGTDIGAGLRLPVKISLEVPKYAIPGVPFDIKGALEPLDFTADQFYKFCNSDPELRQSNYLWSGGLTDRCLNFMKRDVIDPQDGDEFFMRAQVFAQAYARVLGIEVLNFKHTMGPAVETACTVIKASLELNLNDPKEQQKLIEGLGQEYAREFMHALTVGGA